MNRYGDAVPDEDYPRGSRGPRKGFKRWLRDYLSRKIDQDEQERYTLTKAEPDIQYRSKFQHGSFEGWHMRLHRSVDGHIVEAWRNVDRPYTSSGAQSSDINHMLFTIRTGEDMGKSMSDIFVQLALRT